ncbi:N-acetylglucosamine-6-phosphate deacetylase [Thalassobacillus sp. CUG 92003]|uniref:N-acetylglucosamine-6-phosphate deacetylase n=1 Tax=Thalassobacillus sp. CUG 92003 TaxID=2736641 RepID=UPI0015E72AE0|nr:N-acetylglucosamine-6-phosphate deacetylase [Thalassobacillus sp. CUG 92003]
MYYLKGNIITDGKVMPDQIIEVDGCRITGVGVKRQNHEAPMIEVKNGFICPGFVDIHFHGVDGMDFMDEGKGVFRDITTHLPKYGITSCLATSRTASLPDINEFLQAATRYNPLNPEGARILGVHLEGPWLSPKYSGAQRKELIRALTWSDVISVIEPYQSIISKMTIAPEEVKDPTIIPHLVSLGIQVSAGHTNASIEQIRVTIEHGLSQLTHTFNAMSPVDHRRPGTAAAALYFENLICELITDGVHVESRMIELLYKMKRKENIALISDCTGYNQFPDGEFLERGKELVRKGNEVRLKNGSLAGSAITLNEGVKHAISQCNIPLAEAVFMATETPAKAAGTDLKIGKIKPGFLADFVILDQDMGVTKTIIDGKVMYSSSI